MRTLGHESRRVDLARPEGVPWPGKDTPLYRTVLPKHLRAVEAFRPVTGAVIVEASPRVEDNAWLLGVGKDDPFVVGIVGNLEPGSPTFARDLERFAADPLFRGIRVSDKVATKLLDGDTLAGLQLESISDYKTLQRIPILYALEKGEDAARRFCSLNSQRAYRWIERPGRRVTH